MAEPGAIVYWDRRAGREERERVYGGALVRWLYGRARGQWLVERMADRWLSRLIGIYQSSPFSRTAIASFVRNYGVPMEEFEAGPYGSFNEFFVRRFRPGARTFDPRPDVMPAFAEGRYLAYEMVQAESRFPVKAAHLTPEMVLGERHAAAFRQGPLLIARLCPTDYHRFHYPDGGRTLEHYRIPGLLHSVNPVALLYRSEIFATNERQVSIVESESFGRLAYVEIGAMGVGKIVQTHPADHPFRRGDEKGFFLFGASTILLFGERGRWRPDADLLEQTAQRRETLVRLGERIAACKDRGPEDLPNLAMMLSVAPDGGKEQ